MESFFQEPNIVFFLIPTEIDECEFVTCAHSCIDLPGTFACSCFDGYQIASDFVSCIGQ